ncbi:MAG: serine hydrolase [Actinobacteria bacterium]|nr:serine hydrolase [Actinomycetota bacterium]
MDLGRIDLPEPDLPREMDAWLARTLTPEPWPYVMGPIIDRGAPNGVAWVGGREVARWGDPGRREMAFSIAKSALGTVAGLAFDDGLLPDLDRPVVESVPLSAFGGDVYGPGVPDDPAAARQITWRQLLTQTSEWRGTLFDIPWWADPQGKQLPGEPRVAAGTRFSYNDVRTNLCSLALTHLLGASNAATLGARVLEPLGVGAGWGWHGLHQMRTRLGNGEEVVVTTGGSHWGGGLWLTAEELARFGRLHLDGGEWEGRRLLSEEWCGRMLAPADARPAYGLMWWRNPEAGVPAGDPDAAPAGEDAFYPGAGIRGFAAHGTGEQIVWCDPDRDLVVVLRWVTDVIPVLAAVTEAVPPR